MFAAQVWWSSDGMSMIAKSLKCFIQICSNNKTTAYGSDKLQQYKAKSFARLIRRSMYVCGSALKLPDYFIHEHCAQMQQIVETRTNIFDTIVFQPIQEHMGHTNAAAFQPKRKSILIAVIMITFWMHSLTIKRNAYRSTVSHYLVSFALCWNHQIGFCRFYYLKRFNWMKKKKKLRWSSRASLSHQPHSKGPCTRVPAASTRDLAFAVHWCRRHRSHNGAVNRWIGCGNCDATKTRAQFSARQCAMMTMTMPSTTNGNSRWNSMLKITVNW